MTSFKTLFLTLFLVVIDQISKYLVTSQLNLAESLEILPFLNFTLILNTGIAFSMFDDGGISGRWILVSLTSIAVSYVAYILIKEKNLHTLEILPLVLILSGGLGNLIDRVFFGYVIDFIHVFYGIYSFYVFNLADSFITLGVVIYLYYLIFLDTKSRA
jgi:signal peptidase II